MFSQVQGAEESDSDKSIGQGVKFQRALEALDRMSRGFSERWDWGVGKPGRFRPLIFFRKLN